MSWFRPFRIVVLALVVSVGGCSLFVVCLQQYNPPIAGVGVATGGTNGSAPQPNGQPAPEGTMPIVYPLLRREANCSLTQMLLNPNNLTFAQTSSHFELGLRAAAQLPGPAGAYPNGCADPTIGVAGRGMAIGQLPNGSYFVAYPSINNAAQLTLYIDNAGTITTRPNLVVSTTANNYVTWMAVADFTGDGKLDIAAAITALGSGPARLAILAGDGIGGFAAPIYSTIWASPSSISGITTADVNSDGKLDIIATASDGMVRMLGNGAGAFSSTILGAVGNYGVIAADFNGDGKLDLASGEGGIQFGDGAGNFVLASGLRFDGGKLAAGDFNGDGKQDLIVLPTDGSGILHTWMGDGFGNFSQLKPNYATIYGAGSADIGVTDLDGDGKLDVVVGSIGGGLYGPSISSNGMTHYLLGRGDGSFASPPAYIGAVLASADFTGDGKPDLLSVEVLSGIPGVRPLLGNGLGSFTPGTFSPIGFGIGNISHRPLFIARDVNGDGKADLVAIEHVDSTNAMIHTRIGDGTGGFAATGPDQAIAFDLADYRDSNRGAPALADFNGDGKLDLAVLGFTTGNRVLAILAGNGDGSFAAALTIDASYGNIGTAVSRVMAADLNGDGKPDLVVADPGAPSASPPVVGGLHIYRNLGGGAFAGVALAGAPARPANLDIADLNGDGKLDLVATTPPGDSLAVLLGNGDASFQTALQTSLPDDAFTSLAIGDIDADGKPDLILGNCCGSTFGWYARGDGAGHFATPRVLPLVLSPAGLQLLDLDNNGHPDLVANIGGYTLAVGVYMNTYSDTLFANGFDSP